MKTEVSIVILRKGEQFWIHQRKMDKRIYPGLWGIGIGGKVDPGESALIAACRELREEAGIDIPQADLIFLFDFSWNSEATTYNGHLFLYEMSDQTVTPCAREFETSCWCSEEAIKEKKVSGQLCPDTKYFWELWTISKSKP